MSILLTGSSIARVISRNAICSSRSRGSRSATGRIDFAGAAHHLRFLRFLSAMILPFRQASDLLVGMWQLIQAPAPFRRR